MTMGVSQDAWRSEEKFQASFEEETSDNGILQASGNASVSGNTDVPKVR